MSETAPHTIDEGDAQIEAQGACETPVSSNCDGTALYTVILNLPDGVMTVPCCEPCKDEHVKRASAEGVPVTVRASTPFETGPIAQRRHRSARERIASWRGRPWLVLGVVVFLLLVAAAVVLLRLAFG
jgi:hypothetical protein